MDYPLCPRVAVPAIVPPGSRPCDDDRRGYQRRPKMTVCVGGICDNGKSLVLASDRMIGTVASEAEPEIPKRIQIHPEWILMYSAEDFSPVFEIADAIASQLDASRAVTTKEVSDAIYGAYNNKRAEEAIQLYVTSRAATSFPIPDSIKPNISDRIAAHRLTLDLLVAGFDTSGDARLLSLDGSEMKVARRDSPGFWAIGSGSDAAMAMLFRRAYGPRLALRKALYYVLEAKYFGEEGSSVGPDTDLSIHRHGKEQIPIKEDTIEELLIPEIVQNLEP